MAKAPDVDCDIGRDHQHCGQRQQLRRNIGINEFVEIVLDEAAPERWNAGPHLQPVFRHRQWTRPRPNLNNDAPGQRRDVQPSQQRTASRPHRSEDNTRDIHKVDTEDHRRKKRI